MTRFILVTYPRCGSNLVASALEDRGDVLAQHEMLHSYYKSTFGDGPNVAKRLYRDFWRHPRHTWDRQVFDTPYPLQCDPRELAGAGFIIHRCMGDLIPGHPRLHHATYGRGIWDIIATDADVKIIFVHRDNQLKRRVSEMLAEMGSIREWQLYAKARTFRRVRIISAENQLFSHFRWYDEFYAAAKEKLVGQDSMEVVYEELTRDLQGVMRGVQAFLGLEPVDVYPRTFKGEHRPMSKAIKNYDDVVRMFQGIEFERFLDGKPEAEVEAHAKATPQKK